MSDHINEEQQAGDVIAIINNVFHKALTGNASDIHIEPKEKTLDVRMRVDGKFADTQTFPGSLHQAMVTRMKMLADLQIDETRLPQDGKTSLKMADQNIDLRISILPTIYGEKICIRILKTDNAKVSLEDLGFLDYSLKRIKSALDKPYGIILVTGPTGSGKTTTLYGMLSKFDPLKKNISTLEDPVEYKMKDVNQTQIRKDIGFDFADGLRTLVRQDPDIIMVGEIRDKTTANLSIESALTGHLVFSTIHTNTAAATIQRLLNMGIERYLIPTAMQMIMAQRLVQRICENCKEIYRPNKSVIKELKKEIGHVLTINEEKIHLYRGKGCSKCAHSGYNGRVGIHEVLPMSDNISEMILNNKSTSEIEEEAKKEGMLTMKQDGLIKTVMGLSTFEDVISVIG